MAPVDETGISDQAMAIYTWFTYGVMIQLFNIFGIITNITNIICFWRIGFEDAINISLLALSVSDLGSLITMTVACIGLTPAMASANLSFLSQEVVFPVAILPHVTFTRVSCCITAMITLEKCLCITYPLKVNNIFTPKRVAAISIGIFVLFFISDAPNVAANSLGMKFVPSRNKTLLGIVGTGDRETVEKITFIINGFSVTYAAFMVIVTCTTILSVELKRNAKWRETTVKGSVNTNASRRNYKVAKMVVMISTLFIICFIPVSTTTLTLAFVPEMSILGKYLKVSIMIGGFGYLMESVNFSVNIFFYYHMSSHYRRIFRTIFLSK